MLGQDIINNFLTTNTSNPWFVLLVVLGILHVMAQVPGYLARAHISPVSGVIDLYVAKRGVALIAGAAGMATTAAKHLGGAIKKNLTGGEDPHKSNVNTSGLITGDGSAYSGYNLAGKTAAGVPTSATGTTPTSLRTATTSTGTGTGAATSLAGTGTTTTPPLRTANNQIPAFASLYGKNPTVHDAAANMMKKIRSGQVAFGVAAKGGDAITRDPNGNTRKIEHGKNTSAQGVGALLQFAALSDVQKDAKGREDPAAEKATLDSVNAAGKLKSPFLDSSGKLPPNMKDAEKQRLEGEKAAQRDIGTKAYMQGKKGNDYTGYLNKTYGAYTQEAANWGAYLMANHDATSSGWNAAKAKSADTLDKLGIPNEGHNSAVASHPTVGAMKMGEQATAIPAVSKLVSAKLASMNLPSSAKDSGLIQKAAADGVLSRLTPPQIHAAHAISQVIPNIDEPGMLAMADTVVHSTVGARPSDYEATVTNLVHLEREARASLKGQVLINSVSGGAGSASVDYSRIGAISSSAHAAGIRGQDMEQIAPHLIDTYSDFQDLHQSAFQPNSSFDYGGITNLDLGSIASTAKDISMNHGPDFVNLPNIVLAQKMNEAHIPVQSVVYRAAVQYVDSMTQGHPRPVDSVISLTTENLRACEAISYVSGPKACADPILVNTLANIPQLKGAPVRDFIDYYENSNFRV
jgi:hypothetical protein